MAKIILKLWYMQGVFCTSAYSLPRQRNNQVTIRTGYVNFTLVICFAAICPNVKNSICTWSRHTTCSNTNLLMIIFSFNNLIVCPDLIGITVMCCIQVHPSYIVLSLSIRCSVVKDFVFADIHWIRIFVDFFVKLIHETQCSLKCNLY